MKRPLTILTIAILTILVLYACSSTIRTANTSFVTITIGGNSQKATLHAEKATPWLRLKYYLADAKLMPEAYAYIPSVVQVLVVTVTAADITTPIVGIDSINPDQTISFVRIEVPNGSARQFTVEGIRGVDSQTYYRGTATADLTGLDMILPVSMTLVGPGVYVDFTTGNNVITAGSATNPYKTITYALSQVSASAAIYVQAGTYPPGVAAAGEVYPLQLKQSTALICTGTGFSSVIDASTFGTTAILGNDNAAVDNCMIKVGQGGTGVTDIVSLQPTATRINGSLFEVPAGATGPSVGIVLTNDKSVLLDTSVTGTNVLTSQAIGVQVNGGKPAIIGNTITNLQIGIDLSVNAGDAVITGNVIALNTTTGISIASSGKPVLTSNIILGNSGTGILISNGNPSITSNIIEGNSVGIEVRTVAGLPTIKSNSIFCNTLTDLFSTSTSTLDVTNNSWDHDSATTPPGPTEWISVNGPFDCNSGSDVCAQNGPMPVYVPFSAAVPGGCVFLLP